jgi:hypothetical protein
MQKMNAMMLCEDRIIKTGGHLFAEFNYEHRRILAFVHPSLSNSFNEKRPAWAYDGMSIVVLAEAVLVISARKVIT